jgi:hypothetical protein
MAFWVLLMALTSCNAFKVPVPTATSLTNPTSLPTPPASSPTPGAYRAKTPTDRKQG